MTETHVLCCDCDECLGPGIPQTPLPVTRTRQGSRMRLPVPFEVTDRDRVVSVSPELPARGVRS